ncbi:MAG: hypothetical protein PHN63_01475, partial [Candidatus Omnitrophica bacterium]|nr:hypothetical protein [Candidatus Omnitrophota bacterium]
GILWAGIILEVFYAFFRALIRPIESYDAVAIYAIKSKIFYLDRYPQTISRRLRSISRIPIIL